MTVYLPLEYPSCKDSQSIVKFGKTSNNKQRYSCQNDACDRKTFIVDYDDKGWLATIKEKSVDMAMNGSGIRDTSRVLSVSQGVVMSTIKKRQFALAD